MHITFLDIPAAHQALVRAVLHHVPDVTFHAQTHAEALSLARPNGLLLASWSRGQDIDSLLPVMACGAPLVLLAESFAAGEVARLVRSGVHDCLTWAELDRLPAIITALDDSDNLPVIHTTAPYNAMSVAVVVIVDNVFAYVNQVTLDWMGYTRQEMLGMHYLTLVPPELREAVGARGDARMQGMTASQRYELPVLRKDGVAVWADFNVALVRYRGKQARLVTVLDITERKKAETTLRAAARMLETAANNNAVVVFTAAEDGCISQIEGSFTDAPDAPSLIGHSLYRLFDDDELSHHIDRVLLGEVHRGRIEHQGRFWTLVLTPVQDERGCIIGLIGVATDVTETALTRLELQHSERRFDATFRAMPVATLLIATDTGQILDANQQAAHLTGYTLDDLIGGVLPDMALFDDDSCLIQALHGHADCTEQQADLRLHTAPGDTCHVRIFREEVVIGQQPAILLMLLDNTPQHAMMYALRESEERLLAIFNGFADAILIFDIESGFVLLANDTTHLLMGYLPDALRGTPFIMLFSPEDDSTSPITLATLRGTLATTGATLLTLSVQRADGSLFPADVSLSLIDWDGRQVGLAAVRDVSIREATRHALIQAETQLKSIVSHAPIVLFMIDMDGIFTLSTGRALQEIGLEPGQVVGQSVYDVYADAPDVIDDIGRALRGESFASTYHTAGRVFHSHYLPVRDDWGHMNALCGVAIDITERINAQAAETRAARLEAELVKERELITLKEGFISMMSHEFRNPLTSIMMSKDILKRKYDRLDDARRLLHLDRIGFQARFMTELLDDVLLVMRANMGYLVLEPEFFDLTELVQDIVQQLGLHENRAHAFQWQRDGSLNPVYMDQRLIRYVMVNLLNNAQKYTPEGGAISLATIRQDNALHIRVADTGIGIPPADHAHVFDIFKRGTNTGEIKGTGLGLTMVKFAVEAHHGEISVQSVLNEGTTFSVTLPASVPARARA